VAAIGAVGSSVLYSIGGSKNDMNERSDREKRTGEAIETYHSSQFSSLFDSSNELMTKPETKTMMIV
jgi:hypothetical protein